MPRSLIKAQLESKCPRCREGDIFKYPLRRVLKFGIMNRECAACGALFEPEPGFYYGAMFVSYAITVAIFAAVCLFLYVLVNPREEVYFISSIAAAVAMVPVSFRYSRVLFLYWFGGYRYDPAARRPR